MKKIVTLILICSLSAAMLIGCSASAQCATDAETAYTESALQPETPAKPNPEITRLYGEGAEPAVANVSVEQMVSTASIASGGLCTVCADKDCDGGRNCQENSKCNTPCKVCGDDNCDGGADCTGRKDHQNNHHGGHHGNYHHHNG